MKFRKLHIGKAIKNRVQELKISQTVLAAKLGMTQSNISKIYERESIDTDKLVNICEVLDFDFFSLYKTEEYYTKIESITIGDNGVGVVDNYGHVTYINGSNAPSADGSCPPATHNIYNGTHNTYNVPSLPDKEKKSSKQRDSDNEDPKIKVLEERCKGYERTIEAKDHTIELLEKFLAMKSS